MTLIKPALAANEITNSALGSIAGKSAGEGLAFYIGELWKTMVIVGGLAFLVYLVWGGIQWSTARGDKAKLDEAQHKIFNSLVGLGILVGSFAIISFVQAVLKINLLQPIFPDNL